jgi:3-methyladenine DNA glycosylase AlkD
MPRSSTRALVEVLDARLRAHADPKRAAVERAYLKSDLDFLGAGVPVVRAVIRDFCREYALDRRALVALVRALWAGSLHEERVAAIELLGRNKRLLTADELPLIEGLIRRSFTWAYVDALAIDIAGTLVEREPALRSELDRWAQDPDFWVRRAAMLALLRPLRSGEGDFERFGRYADAMLEEREFFIRKAIGWVLREVSKRRPQVVYEWLLPRAGRASGVTMREAVKYLPPEERKAVLLAAQQRSAESRQGGDRNRAPRARARGVRP